ncbi:MAG: hypothetical protein LW862_21165 [Rubrivivax sp.]|jgi:hypothetical protein|nr:hypothetical protein [Rubrivivax sp.]
MKNLDVHRQVDGLTGGFPDPALTWASGGRVVLPGVGSAYDLGTYTRHITTRSAEAQVWFDRGLNWVFGFNYAEAIMCFGKELGDVPLAVEL